MTLADRFPHLSKLDLARLEAELDRLERQDAERQQLARLMKQRPFKRGASE